MAISAGDALWTIGGDLGNLKKSLAAGHKMVKRQGDFIQTHSQAFKTMGAGMAIAGTAIAAGLGVCVAKSNEFGTAMAEVSTLGVKQLGVIETGVKDVATRYGVDLVQSAKGAYQAISATGFDGAKAIDVLDLATKAATAGVSSVTAAVELGAGTMNAFGKEVGDLSGIYDEAFIAVKSGVTTFEELAATTGKLAPSFAAAKLSSEEMFAAIAALTKGGIGTAEAVTYLKAAMTNVAKPTSEAQKLAAKLGLEFNQAALESKGLKGFLDEVTKATGGSSEKMRLLFGSTEAATAVLALTGNQAQDFSNILDEMAHKTGTFDAAFQTMKANDPAMAFRQLGVEMDRMKVAAGDALQVGLQPLIEEGLIPLVQWLSSAAEAHPTLTTAIVGLGAVTAGIIVPVGILGMAIPGLITGFKGIAVAGAAASTALGVTGAGIAATAATVAAAVTIIVSAGAAIAALAITIYDTIKQIQGIEAADTEWIKNNEELKKKYRKLGAKDSLDYVIQTNEARLQVVREQGMKELDETGKISQEKIDMEKATLQTLQTLHKRRGDELPSMESKLQNQLTATQAAAEAQRIDGQTKAGQSAVDAQRRSAEEISELQDRNLGAQQQRYEAEENALLKAIKKSRVLLGRAHADYAEFRVQTQADMVAVVLILENFNIKYEAAFAATEDITAKRTVAITNYWERMAQIIEQRAEAIKAAIENIGAGGGAGLDSGLGGGSSASGSESAGGGRPPVNVNNTNNFGDVNANSPADIDAVERAVSAGIQDGLRSSGAWRN